MLKPIEVNGGGDDQNSFIAGTSSSGTKTTTDIDRIPQSISVVTRKQMDAQGAESVGGALRYTPGVRSEAYGVDTRYDWFFLRGFAAQDKGLYLNGLQLHSQSYANFHMDPYSLERIDVLLGPSSSLFGAGSPGGLINLVSKKPVDEDFTELSILGGIPNSGSVAIDINRALNESGTMLARLTALGQLGETQVDNVDNNHGFIAPSFTYKPNEDTRLTVMANLQKDDTGTATSFLPYSASVKSASYGRIPTDFFTGDTNFDSYKRDQWMLGYEFEHSFENDVKFSQSTRYSSVSTNYKTLYGVGLASSYFPAYPDTLLLRQALAADQSVGTFQTDNHLESDFDTGLMHHRLLTGLDYSYEDFDNKSGFANDPSGGYYALDLVNPVYGIAVTTPDYTTNARTKTHRLGLYLQDQITLAEKLDLTAGLRHDWVYKETENRLTATETSSHDSALTGRIGASYELFTGFRPYMSYATSFDPLTGTDAAGVAFDPETGEQYEIGAKYEDPEGRFRLTAAWFNLTRQNVLTTDPNNTAYKIQTGEVRSRGIELQATARLLESWDVLASYTNYDLEITRSENGDQGKVPVGVPQQMASLWVNHSFSEQLEGLRVGAGARYVGKSYADAANTLEVPSYVVADAGIGYTYKNADLSFNVTNIFDKKYVAACAGENACYYGERRALQAKLTFKW
ncbi:TonB-dependent siderophore receptor [Roseibium litorale]|uniref:TonB-dependent siderophore receptor n=1 Tax=Roseibium litorale TaxID=2803841 RepID=UPI0031B5CC8F